GVVYQLYRRHCRLAIRAAAVHVVADMTLRLDHRGAQLLALCRQCLVVAEADKWAGAIGPDFEPDHLGLLVFMWTPRLRPLCVACPPVAPVFMAYGVVANFAVASSTAHIATTCSAVGTSHNLTEATNVMAPGILNPLIGHGWPPCSGLPSPQK